MDLSFVYIVINQFSLVNTSNSIMIIAYSMIDHITTVDCKPLLETINPVSVNIMKAWGMLRSGGIVLIA